jgi:DNA-binding HxlR family transcriptional regulator
MIDLDDIDPALREGVLALATDMRTHGHRRHEPVREIFGLIGDKWTTLILLVLRIGTWRHAELRRILGRLGSEDGISQRMLTLKLRALERHGMVARTVTDHIPPRVSYALTPLGNSLTDEARRLIVWVQTHRGMIDAARAAFDAPEDQD